MVVPGEVFGQIDGQLMLPPGSKPIDFESHQKLSQKKKREMMRREVA